MAALWLFFIRAVVTRTINSVLCFFGFCVFVFCLLPFTSRKSNPAPSSMFRDQSLIFVLVCV